MDIIVNNRNQTSFSGGLKALNAINPVSYYANRYLRNSAKLSGQKFDDIIPELFGKINLIPLKSGKTQIYAWDINPKQSKRYVLFLHGMAQNVSNYQQLYKTVIEKNMGVLTLEYRGYGSNKKTWLCEDALRKDVETAYQCLINKKGIKPQEIIVIGHSMGGALATHFASKHHNIKSLILICPITNLNNTGNKFATNTNLGLGIPKKLNDFAKYSKLLSWLSSLRFNSLSKIKNVITPTYIVQSINDTVTPIQHSRKLARIARKNNIIKEFWALPNGGHKVDSKKIEAVSSILDKINLSNL